MLGVLEGAAIPELNMENIAAFLAEDEEDEDMEALCNALEDVARAEFIAYKQK